MNRVNKKTFALTTILIVLAVFVSLKYFSVKEKEELETFVFEYNEKVAEEVREVVEEKETLEIETPFSVSKNSDSETADFNYSDDPKDDIDEEEKVYQILPYTEPLPPLPDSETVKYHFVDTNQNKVRDDIEILIVEEFEDDKNVVEALFAEARRHERGLYLAKNSLLTEENIQKSVKDLSYGVRCFDFYYDKYRLSRDPSAGQVNDEVFGDYYNSLERMRQRRIFSESFHGYIGYSIDANETICGNFFTNSLNWTIN